MNKPSFDPLGNCSTLVDLLRWRATDQPNRRAYTFLLDGEEKESHLTYGELDRQARAIGAMLQSVGAVGERALLVYPPGLEYIAAFFGCLYAGIIAVPVYPPNLARANDRALPRLRAVIHDAQPLIALTTSSILSRAGPFLAQSSEFQAMRWLATETTPDSLAEEWQTPAVRGDSLAFLQYTSGSTAMPKGVMVSHHNILYNERMIQKAFETSEESGWVSWLPLFHDMGLIGGALQPFYTGAYCVLMSPLDFLQSPFRWLRAISRYKACVSGGPNFAYDLCVRKITPEQRARLDLSNWRLAFNGAEPVRHETLERFAETFEPCGLRRETLYPCYGLAEATLFVTGGLKSAPPVFQAVQGSALGQDRIIPALSQGEGSRILVGCGRTWLDQKVVIADPESLNQSPPDRMGEIWISGPNVAQGYWNRPEETECTFRAYLADTGEGPFLRTGDLGFLKDGELFITGRLKDLIIIDGRNHYPQDIELTVEKSHPAIRPGCCAAFSVDTAGEERLVITAEIDRSYQPGRCEEQAKPDSDSSQRLPPAHGEIIKAVQQAVVEYHEVQAHDIVLLKMGSIPKTSSGKIQRHACRADYVAGTLDVWGK